MRLYLGWDTQEMRAWNVAQTTARMRTHQSIDIRKLSLGQLQAEGLYTRPTEVRARGFWDVISAAPMATGHAIARFLIPHLEAYQGWALFTDGDVLFREDLAHLFALADDRYAVQVVQHHYEPTDTAKMEGQLQTRYARKNWSSVMLFNCSHPANRALDLALVNTVPGRDLHRFCWLDDALIGTLPAQWNHLVGHSVDPNPAIVHFTTGVPDMPGYEHVEYADEWYRAAQICGYRLIRPAVPAGVRA